jgi:hypothetical protein
LLLKGKFQTIGNASKSDYAGNFSDYALKYVPELEESHTRGNLQSFFDSEITKDRVNKILNLGIIRSHFARLLEVFIIIDRGIYLIDNGFRVELYETFNRELSPRNISLFGSR